MTSEHFTPQFSEDPQLRGYWVQLEEYRQNMNTIVELGGSVNNDDRVMLHHRDVAHDAAHREAALRELAVGNFATATEYWQAVAEHDEASQKM